MSGPLIAPDRALVSDPMDWDDQDQVDRLRWLCLQEDPDGLSALARHVLNFDFFETREEGKLRRITYKERSRIWFTCGLVSWGPHREMMREITKGEDVFLLCSRRSMKTTMIVARIIQMIAINRNIRILCQMETGMMAESTVTMVGDILRDNDKLKRLFGEFYERGRRWEKRAIIVSGRDHSLRDPTLAAHGAETRQQGNRYDVFICDDPIGFQSARNPVLVQKANLTFDHTLAQGDETSHILGAMTPYAEDDLSQRALRDRTMNIRVVRFDCGFVAKQDDDGAVVLEGWQRFPNHTFHRLLQEAKRNWRVFNLNYALMVGSDHEQVVRRDQFRVAPYDPMRFGAMNCYLMTDTAVSEHDRSCMSAIALVALSHEDIAYVVDANVGFWSPNIFIEHFLEMFQTWASRMRIRSIVMEQTSANRVYRSSIQNEMERRGLACNWDLTPRNSRLDKATRIRSVITRIETGRLIFLDSIRQTFNNHTGQGKVLFRPNSIEINGKLYPQGEIVDQILNWRDREGYDGVMDFPDALGDLDITKTTGERYVRPSQKPMMFDDPDQILADRFSYVRGGKVYEARSLRQQAMGLGPNNNDGPAWRNYL